MTSILTLRSTSVTLVTGMRNRIKKGIAWTPLISESKERAIIALSHLSSSALSLLSSALVEEVRSEAPKST